MLIEKERMKVITCIITLNISIVLATILAKFNLFRGPMKMKQMSYIKLNIGLGIKMKKKSFDPALQLMPLH